MPQKRLEANKSKLNQIKLKTVQKKKQGKIKRKTKAKKIGDQVHKKLTAKITSNIETVLGDKVMRDNGKLSIVKPKP